MTTHSSVLAWRIPETGEPGGLPSMGSHRVGHDWSDLPSSSGCHPPASLPSVWGGASPQLASSSLVFAQSFVLWASPALPWVRAFRREVLSLSLSLFLSLAIPQFGFLSHFSPLRLSSRHSGLVLTLSMQPTPPCSAPTYLWWMWASGLLLCWECS